ncbi:ATP-binding protein [Streptomyces xiamenensis]|uniref:ATP-binding protein n=1 Tax=Streptomyces xiamenensis TaxID=408015 RepID=UPI0035E3765B
MRVWEIREASQLPGLRRDLRRELAQRLPGNVLDDLQIVIAELAGNAVQHGAHGPIGVSIHTAGPQILTRVRSAGHYRHHTTPASDITTLAESGRGIAIIDALVDEHGHDHQHDVTTCWARLTWH